MLCRKQIILNVMKDSELDYNYQYKLMKILYKAINEIDSKMGEELHSEGFKLGVKQYKLFNFTLLFKNATFAEKEIKLKINDEVRLILSGKNEIINSIIKGLIFLGGFEIGKTKFKVLDMKPDKRVRFANTMLYKVISPIVESTIIDDKKEYTTPFQSEFYDALAKNLLRKYQLIYNKKYEGELYFDIDNVLKVKHKNINKIRDKGQIKGTGKYEIWLQAEPDMQKVAYYCGLGQNNSTGAGMLSYITGRWEN